MQYSLIYASLINPYQGTQTTYSEKLLQKKAASFQFLSWQVVPSFTVSFFQGLVWQPADEKNRQHVDAAFFSPIIYTQAALYGLNHQKNNIVLGTNFNWKMNSSIVLYSQLMLDNIKHGKSSDTDAGIQTGVKYFDAFGVSNLFLQAEYNRQNNRPYQTSTGNNYTHYGQQLAYPLSAYCGNEAVFIVSWQHKRFFINGKSNYFVSDNQQTYKRSVLFNDGRFGYLIHPKTNMNIAMGINWRTEVINNRIYNIDEKNNTRFFYLSLKTSLYNVYWDF